MVPVPYQSFPAPVLSHIIPALYQSCPTCVLSCISPVPHQSCPTPVLFCTSPVPHHSCPTRVSFCTSHCVVYLYHNSVQATRLKNVTVTTDQIVTLLILTSVTQRVLKKIFFFDFPPQFLSLKRCTEVRTVDVNNSLGTKCKGHTICCCWTEPGDGDLSLIHI